MVQFQTPKQSFNPSYSDNLDFRSFIETVYRSAFFGDPNFSREVALMQTYVSRSELLRNSNAVAQEFQFLILNSLKGLIKGIISKALKVNVEIDFIPNDLVPYLLDSFRKNFQISEVTQCGAYKPYSVDAVQTTVCFISRVADDEVRVLINPAVLFSLEDRYLNDYFDTLLKELRR
ncbi:MAG: hypothetical protein NZO16_05510, partial [Deltaproteobacteria bacterium]|nr:hypothetical protein [Deltaproteobacteria bacterium]